jgi:hypothetical protein
MAKIKKTTLFVEVDDKEFTVSYSGTLTKPQTRKELKHNERLIKILMSDDTLMDFFYNIVNPAVRHRKNKARKARKQAQADTPP